MSENDQEASMSDFDQDVIADYELSCDNLSARIKVIEKREAEAVHTRNARITELESGQNNADQHIYKLESKIRSLEAEITGLRTSRDDWRDAYDAAKSQVRSLEGVVARFQEARDNEGSR